MARLSEQVRVARVALEVAQKQCRFAMNESGSSSHQYIVRAYHAATDALAAMEAQDER